MVFARMLPILGAVTFFAGNAFACTCGETNISDEFNSAEIIAFRGTVLSSTLSSQCLAKMKVQPQAERAPEAGIVDSGEDCSVSNTLEILEYLKGRLADTLVVQTQPLFMGIGSCATSLPPGSTFTVVASYDGVNEITVGQCNTVFSEQDIARSRRWLKDPDASKDFRDEAQRSVNAYDQLYELSDQYKEALTLAGKDKASYTTATFARVRVMIDRRDWTRAFDELQTVRMGLDPSAKKTYDRLLAETQALMGVRAE
jgi:hypothetical protein